MTSFLFCGLSLICISFGYIDLDQPGIAFCMEGGMAIGFVAIATWLALLPRPHQPHASVKGSKRCQGVGCESGRTCTSEVKPVTVHSWKLKDRNNIVQWIISLQGLVQ